MGKFFSSLFCCIRKQHDSVYKPITSQKSSEESYGATANEDSNVLIAGLMQGLMEHFSRTLPPPSTSTPRKIDSISQNGESATTSAREESAIANPGYDSDSGASSAEDTVNEEEVTVSCSPSIKSMP